MTPRDKLDHAIWSLEREIEEIAKRIALADRRAMIDLQAATDRLAGIIHDARERADAA